MPSVADPALIARRSDPMLPAPFRIARRRRETADTFSLELEPENAGESMQFLPGQFNMLYLFGNGEVPVSIASVTGKPLLHTIRATGSVTRQIGKLRRGDYLGVRGPFGSHWPLSEAVNKDLVIVSGGLGLAPLRAALHRALLRPGKVFLMHGARSPQEVLYNRELEKLRARSGCDLKITVDRATPGWLGSVGVVTSLIPLAGFDPGNCLALICGPEIMMRFVVLELKKRGVPERSIFLSMERNMKCAIGHCGHCQFGPDFICRDGPIFRYDRVRDWLKIPEL